MEDSPSLEAALPDQDADDEKKDDDDEEDRSSESLNDFGWVECMHWLLLNKTKSWQEYNCSPSLFQALSYIERSSKIGWRKIQIARFSP